MEDQSQVENNRQKAEVFDALGHPTRLLILKALSEGSLGFADLKKKTAIESSGHLQHHLTKLDGLIKTDEYGKYCLSDEGRDALLTVQTVESSSPEIAKRRHRFNTKTGLVIISLLLVGLLVATSIIAVNSYNQADALRKNSQVHSSFNPFNVIPDDPMNAKLFDAPQIKLLSPDNRTYNVNSIPVVFGSANSSAAPSILIWVVYSLDGQANQTVTGDSPTGPMVTNLTNGSHTIVLYVKDNHQLYGTSAPVTFTVDM